jgi:type II secretory pathway pseudopilin PulG
MRSDRLPAFTLLELLLVIALLALIAAVVIPDFSGTRQAEELNESARRLEALVVMCRAEAMNQSTAYRVEFRRDGTVRARRQLDALQAPHIYVPVDEPWSRTPPLLESVWVEAVQLLPEGPPPIYLIDDRLQLPEMEVELTPVTELEADVAIDFGPDGSCPSLRWVLRDPRGHALLLTLEGRLGRVRTEDWTAVAPGEAPRPPALPVEEEPKYDVQDFER